MEPSIERRPIPWLLICLTLALIGTWLVFRVQSGLLFLVPLPWDAPVSTFEIADAAARSRDFIWGPFAAMICFFGLAICTPLAAPARFAREIPDRLRLTLRMYPWLCVALLLAGTLDFATTLLFFQRREMHLEMHAGVVLTAYAFGRTSGLIAAKVVQLGGLLLLVSYVPPLAGRLLLVAGTALCIWAASENIQHLAAR